MGSSRVSNEKLDLTTSVGSDDKEVADYQGILNQYSLPSHLSLLCLLFTLRFTFHINIFYDNKDLRMGHDDENESKTEDVAVPKVSLPLLSSSLLFDSMSPLVLSYIHLI